MSEDSSSPSRRHQWPALPWSPFAAVLIVLFSFLVIQQLAAIMLLFIPSLLGWDSIRADEWLVNSSASRFVFILLAEAMTVGLLIWFLSYKRAHFRQVVGLDRLRWKYAGYAIAGYGVYFLLFVAVIAVVRVLLPIDVTQEQALGFQRDAHGASLAMAFIGLAVLPPIVEEIVFRGFLYGTLRSSRVKALAATIITSVLFGSLHLFGGINDGLLWIAFIDTLLLSLVLCFIRERTGSIWACIAIHAIKNAVVFVNLFIIGTS